MLSKHEKIKLKTLIADTVVLLCKNGLDSKASGEVSIEGLIGITLNEEDLILVSMKESLQVASEMAETPNDGDSAFILSVSPSRKRKLQTETNDETKPPQPTKVMIMENDLNDDTNSHTNLVETFSLPPTDQPVTTKNIGRIEEETPKSEEAEQQQIQCRNLSIVIEPMKEHSLEQGSSAIKQEPLDIVNTNNINSVNVGQNEFPPCAIIPKTEMDIPGTSFNVETIPDLEEPRLPLSERTLSPVLESSMSRNTYRKMIWALKMYENWRGQSYENLRFMSQHDLNVILCKFILGARKECGSYYPGKTMYEMMASIQRYCSQVHPYVNILRHPGFKPIQETLDCYVKSMENTETKRAEDITAQHEEILKKKGLLGTHSPQVLLDTLIYQISKYLLLSKNEQRSLRTTQFHLKHIDGCEVLEFQDTNDGVSQLQKLLKVSLVRIWENSKDDLCLVKLHKLYRSKCPVKLTGASDYYLQPIKRPVDDIWYSDTPIGHNTLGYTVAKLCKTAGFNGNFTNKSLKNARPLSESFMDNEIGEDGSSTPVLCYHKSIAHSKLLGEDHQSACITSQLHSKLFEGDSISTPVL